MEGKKLTSAMTFPREGRLCTPFPFLLAPFKLNQPPDVQADAPRQPTRSSKAKRATHGVFFINSQLEHPIPADLHTLYIHRDRTEARLRRAVRGMAGEGDGGEGKTEARRGKEGGQTGRRERIHPGRK